MRRKVCGDLHVTGGFSHADGPIFCGLLRLVAFRIAQKIGVFLGFGG